MVLETKKILVIDDEYDIVELVKAILRTRGYNVLIAYDGEQGFELIMREKPDLVITDLRMPGMSGMELCKRVRRTPEIADTTILVITSLTLGTDKPDEYWAAGLGSDDFLPKPFDPLSLLGRVEYLLRRKEYRSTSARMSHAAEEPQAGSDLGGSAQRLAIGGKKTWSELDPDEVVRVFVESWNDKDFAREFGALGEEMLGSLRCEEYVQRRAQLYADEDGERTRHVVLDCDVKVSHNVASVSCLREDMVNGVPHRKDERYTCKKTANGWKIIGVKSRPVTFTIE